MKSEVLNQTKIKPGDCLQAQGQHFYVKGVNEDCKTVFLTSATGLPVAASLRSAQDMAPGMRYQRKLTQMRLGRKFGYGSVSK